MNAISLSSSSFRKWLRSPSAVLVIWFVLAVAYGLLAYRGIMPNGDVDDLMKMIEIRHLMATGDPFDRIIPGVMQPEPMTSHWPWIVDAPYALVGAILSPLIGLSRALAVTASVVPLALLLLSLFVLRRIVKQLGFATSVPVLLVCVFVGQTAFLEFMPWRIDYHNLQMLLVLTSAMLTMQTGRHSAALNGLIVAFSIAISAEAAPFLLAPMVVYAWRYVAGIRGSDIELGGFGAAMAVSALGFYGLVLGPNWAGPAVCDRYSLPHLVAMFGAGSVFSLCTIVSIQSRFGRLAAIVAGAAIVAVLLVMLFPNCLAGPYGSLSDYMRQHWLARIEQERGVFANIGSLSFDKLWRLVLPMLGCGAALAVALRRMDRAWTVFAVFALIAFLLPLAQLRYIRFLPLFAGPGIAVIVGQLIIARPNFARSFALKIPADTNPALLCAPGAIVLAAIFAAYVATPRAAPVFEGIDLANACDEARLTPRAWPAGARLMSSLSVGIVTLSQPGAPEVVAVPFHTAASGNERAIRFFDPSTPDPKVKLDQSGATHVAVCRIEGTIPEELARQFPLAAALVDGRPPEWLKPCPDDPSWALRVYRYEPGGPAGAFCPRNLSVSE